MKKKISILLCMFACVLCVLGTKSQAKDAMTYDESSLTTYTDTIISSFSQMSDDDFAKFQEGSELEVNLTLLQNGLPVDRENFLKMIEAWQAANKEFGAYQGHGQYKFEADSKEVTVSAVAEYADRKATIDMVYDEKGQIESLTINGDYSTGEILEKAGLNTILGMGTVFAVLIFISILISLFKYIPDGSKKKEKGQKPVEVPAAQTTSTADEVPADDAQLVAVISAAIAAAEGTSSDGFVVRSIRRRTSNKWKRQ